MEANIQSIKIELIQWLTTLDDRSIIQKVIELRKNNTTNWWEELSKEERKSIEQGLSDAKEGKFVHHSEVRKVYEKWL